MESTRFQSSNFSNYTFTSDIQIEIPTCCPYCNLGNNPTLRLMSYDRESDKTIVIFLTSQCPACGRKTYLTNRNSENERKVYKLLSQYPKNTLRTFDDLIVKCSPRFVESYNAAYTSEQNGYFDLAGMGYRASCEILIKDWAEQYSGESHEQIAKYKLNDAISHFFKGNIAAFNSSDVVRDFGNEATHWDRPNNFDSWTNLVQIKNYLDILVDTILFNLRISNPPTGRGHSVSKSN